MLENLSRDWPVFLIVVLFTSAVIYLIIDGYRQEKTNSLNSDKNKDKKEQGKSSDVNNQKV
ncbi:MAG TPA: hypothetical protein PKL77_09280 [Candidatus Omnitrophota bacterium]|nr:hypothetical protein [Candidatus Omnitrophota bacterium]